MIIKLVRHGLSEANTREVDATRTGDHNVKLTQVGKRQASLAGELLTRWDYSFLKDALIYVSPYTRTRETLECIQHSVMSSSIGKVYEDPRLREVEWGYNQPENYDEFVEDMRRTHGKFYFRMAGGESPADGYDRISGFIATMMRQIERKNAKKVLIVSHGLAIRCFVMRFMHLAVEEFDKIMNPKHCDIITITNESDMIIPNTAPQFETGQWIVAGLRLPGDRGNRPWPWDCPSCKKREIWPNMPQRQAKCESCGEVVCY